MFEIEAEKRTKNCQEAYNSGFNDGYAVGLKAGKDMNVAKWHDLREDPNDLPKGYKAVLNQKGKETQYDPNRGFLGLDGVGVIAWCEIPKYTEE